MAFTGRYFSAKEAQTHGFISHVLDDKDATFNKALELAEIIAAKSPVAVATIKQNVVYSRDHTVEEGLNHVLLMNMAML